MLKTLDTIDTNTNSLAKMCFCIVSILMPLFQNTLQVILKSVVLPSLNISKDIPVLN